MSAVSMNKKEKLSQHFTLGEMTKTSYKTKDGNIPSHVAIENLKRLCGWLEIQEDFDELIIEVRGSRVWIHFAVRPKNNRRKILFIS